MVRRSSFSRNWRSSKGPEGMASLRRGSQRRRLANDGAQNRIGGLSFGMAIEVENDAVTKHGQGDSLDVLRAQVVAAAHERPHSPALHERLCAARRAAITDVFLGEFVRFGLLGLCGHHQLDGQLLDVRGYKNLSAHRAHFEYFVTVQNG